MKMVSSTSLLFLEVGMRIKEDGKVDRKNDALIISGEARNRLMKTVPYSEKSEGTLTWCEDYLIVTAVLEDGSEKELVGSDSMEHAGNDASSEYRECFETVGQQIAKLQGVKGLTVRMKSYCSFEADFGNVAVTQEDLEKWLPELLNGQEFEAYCPLDLTIQ